MPRGGAGPERRLKEVVCYDLAQPFSFTSAAFRRAVVRTVSPAAFVAVLATSAAERAAPAALLWAFLTSRVGPSPAGPAATAVEATFAAAPIALRASPA